MCTARWIILLWGGTSNAKLLEEHPPRQCCRVLVRPHPDKDPHQYINKAREIVIGVKGQGAWGKGDWCKGCALMFGIQDLLSCYALVLCVYGLPSGCALMLCTLMLCIHGLPSCCVFTACPHVVHSCCVLVSCCALVCCTHVLPSCCELMLCASRPPPLCSNRWMTGLLASG